MRYISEVDNKVFNTEQECLRHENAVRKSREEELERREKLQMDQQNRLDEIYKKDEELRKLIDKYKKDYRVYECRYDPFIDFVNRLCGRR